MDPPSLTYLVAHPTAVGITCLRPLALALALALPVFFVWQHRAGRRVGALRAAAFLAVVFALAGLRLTVRLPDDRLTLVAAVDMSESIGDNGAEWIQRYVGQVAGALAPGDKLAVLTFANDVRLVRPAAPPEPVRNLRPPLSRTATDVGRVIDSAMTLFPPEGERRILLLTDGNETRGNSRQQVTRLQAAGVRVAVAVPPHRNEPDVRVDKLIVAPLVGEYQIVPLRVVVYNHGKERSALLNLLLDDQIMDSAAVELQPGVNTLELPSRLFGLGSHRLRAELEVEGDTTPGNNYREMGITVRGKTRVLFLSARARSPLVRVLARRGLELDLRAPDRFPRTVHGLLPYHAVLLEDVTASQITASELANLERYVREFGGGVIVAGGRQTFGDGRFRDSALERLLPVTLEARPPRRSSREPLALFLLIDRSNSMGYNSRIGTLRDGEKLRYAKQAALTVIGQLKDQDLVGVIAFDSQPHAISPLRALAENRGILEDLIPRLAENGGTDFYGALWSATQQLSSSRASRRHVVLLTDGDTNRTAWDEYRSLIAQIAAAQISVTTVRIGDNTVNLKLLQDISRKTSGEFHHVTNAEALPELMLRDTTKALGSTAYGQHMFLPELGTRSQLVRGIEETQMPALLDYAYARPKSGADVPLHITRLNRRDPLLAVWQYGLGRVAAFTASPADDAEPWLGWSGFPPFWSQLIQWTARPQTEEEYAIDAARAEGITELTVRTFGPTADDAVLRARLHEGPGTVREVKLVARQPRVFTGYLPDTPGGRYPLTIIRRNRDNQVSERTDLITIPAVDQEPQEEHRRTTPNLSLLNYLTEQTGGVLNPTTRELVKRPLGTRQTMYALDYLLIPLAMLLFLADIAVRRLAVR